MSYQRSIAIASASLMLLAACAAGSGDDSTGADIASTNTAATDSQTGATSNPGAPTSPDGDFDLVSTNDRTTPFDPEGGAVSSDAAVIIDADSPRFNLDDRVNRATESWPTDWTRRTVELDQLLLGLPRLDPRDGIPPIDSPKFQPIATADWLGDREPGALVQFNGEVRFYPLAILTRHEVVNDRFGDVPVAVTFCPLCNTAVTFDARVDGQALRFGVSGLLRNSDLVMWDSETTSLWQQITGESIVGQFAGTQLELIPTAIVSYADALENFPEALSLSTDTGTGARYGSNSYTGYSSSARPFLFDGEPDPRFPALSRVVGVTVGDIEKAYPFEVLNTERAVNDELNGVPIAVLWGSDTADALDRSSIADSAAIGTGIAFDRRVNGDVLTFSATGNDLFTDAQTGSTWTILGRSIEGTLTGEQLAPIQHRNEFWFAWAAFFPGAAVYGS